MFIRIGNKILIGWGQVALEIIPPDCCGLMQVYVVQAVEVDEMGSIHFVWGSQKIQTGETQTGIVTSWGQDVVHL